MFRMNGKILAVLLLALLCAVPARAHERAPVLAGTWYPADAAKLRQSVKNFIASGGKGLAVQGELLGLVAPHAGHVYSGKIAGAAYALLARSKADTVVIISPSHRHAFDGVSVYDKGGYATPLGVTPLDKDFIDALRQAWPDIRYVSDAHAREHAVEIQVPFLQVALPKARIVPLVMGAQDINTCARLALALVRATQASKRRVVLLASSDLSHFHNKADAETLDGTIRDAVRSFDHVDVLQCLATRECEACGGGPIIAVMQACKHLGATRAEVLAQGDSGDVSGDNDKVVGYMAAAFLKGGNGGGNGNPKAASDSRAGEFTEKERALLRRVAREAIRAKLDGRSYSPPEKVPPRLREVRGAFVTLKKHDQLRGCIGNIIGRGPLIETVANMAQAAAFEDPRFHALRPDEYDHLEYEISVLTIPHRITNPDEVEVGRHGLIMSRGWNKGLLLPQVPGEWGWDRRTFLEQTCRKAGMDKNCWKDTDTAIEVFSAEVF